MRMACCASTGQDRLSMRRPPRKGSGVPQYDARGHIAGLDLHRLAAPLKVAAFNQPRFSTRINGDFEVTGRGNTLDNTQLTAKAALTDSSIAGTRLPSSNI